MSAGVAAGARERLAAAQALMARFLDDPELEARIRAEPEVVASEHGVGVEVARKLAAIDPLRVAAFRASRAHKDRIRQRGRGR